MTTRAGLLAATFAALTLCLGAFAEKSQSAKKQANPPLGRPVIFSYAYPWGSDKNPNSGWTDPWFMNFKKVRLSSANMVDNVKVDEFLAGWKTPRNRILARTSCGKKDWTTERIVAAWDAALARRGIDGMAMDEFIGRQVTPQRMKRWIAAIKEIRRRHPTKVLAFWTDSGLGRAKESVNPHAPLLLALRDCADFVMPEIYYRESSAADFKTSDNPFPGFRKKVEEWEAAAPGITPKILMGLGTVQTAKWGYDNHDGIDYGDFLVKQIEVCATDPVLKKMAGLALYAPGYLRPDTLTRVNNAIIKFYRIKSQER